MTTSYRTAACALCGEPGPVPFSAADPASLAGSCARCDDPNSRPCAACVDRALHVVHRAFPRAALPARAAVRRQRWMALAAVASMGLAFMLGVGGGVALTTHVSGRTPRIDARVFRQRRPVTRPATAAIAPAVPAPVAAAAPPAASPMPWPAALLADAGAPSNEPRELMTRAWRLAHSGLDVTVVHTALSGAVAREIVDPMNWLHARLRTVPVERDGALYGVRIEGLPPGSALGVAGLIDGDVVTAINGRPPLGPGSRGLFAPPAPRARERPSMIVVELVRAGRRVVLAVRWRADEL